MVKGSKLQKLMLPDTTYANKLLKVHKISKMIRRNPIGTATKFATALNKAKSAIDQQRMHIVREIGLPEFYNLFSKGRVARYGPDIIRVGLRLLNEKKKHMLFNGGGVTLSRPLPLEALGNTMNLFSGGSFIPLVEFPQQLEQHYLDALETGSEPNAFSTSKPIRDALAYNQKHTLELRNHLDKLPQDVIGGGSFDIVKTLSQLGKLPENLFSTFTSFI